MKTKAQEYQQSVANWRDQAPKPPSPFTVGNHFQMRVQATGMCDIESGDPSTVNAENMAEMGRWIARNFMNIIGEWKETIAPQERGPILALFGENLDLKGEFIPEIVTWDKQKSGWVDSNNVLVNKNDPIYWSAINIPTKD